MQKLIIILAVFLINFCLFSGLTACGQTEEPPKGPDLEGYTLVFLDEFDGEALDESAWQHRHMRSDGGYYHPDMAGVEDGKLVITAQYDNKENGEGWYAGGVSLIKRYTYGYFEVSCKPNDTADFSSAFWIQSKNAYIHELSQGGVGGAEIDIFETYFTDDILYRNYIFSTIHCNGFDDDAENIDSQKLVHYHVPNLLKKYTTFGLLWTEDEYIFYVDGVETVRSSFAKGTSKDEQEVILSITINKNVTLSKDVISKYLVDYVKIYQKI